MAKAVASQARKPRELAETARRAAKLVRDMTSPTRASAILMLAQAERTAGGIAEALGQLRPALGHHLAMLRHAGIIAARREGRRVLYRLTDRGRAMAEVLRRLGA